MLQTIEHLVEFRKLWTLYLFGMGIHVSSVTINTLYNVSLCSPSVTAIASRSRMDVTSLQPLVSTSPEEILSDSHTYDFTTCHGSRSREAILSTTRKVYNVREPCLE